MPNNGTLRLPLKTVGVHDAETVLEKPQDPEITPTAQVSATAALTVSPVATSAAADNHERPPTSIGVDPADEHKTPSDGGADGDDKSPPEDDKDGKDGKNANPLSHAWDWLTNKFDDLWNKLTGSKSDSKSD